MTAVISSQFRLSPSMVAAVCSAHGHRGDECVLACAGISAGCRSLHSDEKGSTQRLPVSMVNYEISLWAAEPGERLGFWADVGSAGLVSNTNTLQELMLTEGAFITLLEFV